MADEVFRTIPGHPNYAISPTGRVLSYSTGIIRKPYKNPKDGYWRVTLYDGDNQRSTIEIHRLVAMAWMPRPEGEDWEIDHIDGNKDRNELANLQWVTHQENMQRAWDLGNHKLSTYNHLYEITRDGVFVDYARTQRELAQKAGISLTRAWYCLKMGIYTSTGYLLRMVY